jgi:hypothetical protein
VATLDRYGEARCTMPSFEESEIDGVIWPWIAEIVSNPEQVEAALAERQRESEEQNAHIFPLVAAVGRLIKT